MEGTSKKVFITNIQKETMIEYLKKNPDLVSGKFSNTFTFKDATKKWNELSNILNSIPGCRKDWKSWRKTWQDMRSRTKIKKSKNKNYLNGTGGGFFCQDTLSKHEEDILDIIKVVSVEGHTSTKESVVDFDFEQADSNIDNLNNKDDNDVTKKKNIEVERLVLDNEESAKLVNTPKKIPKRRTKSLQNSSTAVEMFQKIYKQKLSDKENYTSQKLKLLERIAVSKERTAKAREKSANASERCADVLEYMSEVIKEFI